MKKIISLAIALLTVFFTFGQPGIKRDLLSHKKSEHQLLFDRNKIPASNKFRRDKNVLKNYAATSLRLDSMIFLELSVDSINFDKIMKESYLYDNAGRNISLIQYYWEEMTGRFEPQIKEEYQYDANNNLALIIEYEWGGPWIYYSKDEYSYDAKGNETSFTSYLWNDTDNKWEVYSKSETTYFPDEKMKDYIFYKSSADTLKKYYKREYTYDGNDHLIEDKGSVWDSDSAKWFAYEKEQYYCDATGNDTSIVGSVLDKMGSFIEFSWKRTHDYNENGKLTTFTQYQWDLIDSWYSSYKFELIYNADGSGSSLTEYYYNDVTEKWFNIRNRSYIYDSLYTGSSPFFPLYFYDEDDIGFYTNNKPTQFIDKYIDDDTVTWITSAKQYLYYSDFVKLKESALHTNIITMYPNPASSILSFSQKAAKVEIISITGVVMKSTTNTEQMYLYDIPQGLYIVKVDDLVIGKLIKE